MAQETGSVINVMKRYELKYLMDRGQTAWLVNRLKGHMEPDRYGKTSIASLYYDTPDSRLIRASRDKPAFKEKIRLRSYGLATEDSPVYLELKRKASGVVYKRRVQSTIPEVREFFAGADGLFDDEDELIGISLGYIKHWYSGTEYIINELCIRTDRQGAGAGTFFIREIEKAIRELGLKQIFLLTDSNVPACEFYRKNGFTECTSNVAFAKSIE